MKKLCKILAISLALILSVCSIISVSAAKYVAKPVSESFETKTAFLQPGDMDADGDVDTTDYETLRGLLLDDAADLFSDVNGNDISDICDLVLQNENKGTDFIADGKMNLNGKSLYGKELTSTLNSGAEYKVTYTSSGEVAVKLYGISGVENLNSGDTFKTPLNLTNADVQLYVVGNGTVENLTVARINMDNDYAVN